MRIIFLSLFFLFNTVFLFAEDNITVNEKLIFAKKQTIPERLYINQIFQIDVDIIIAEDMFDSIDTKFLKNYGIEILTQEPVWNLKGHSSFSLTYFLRIEEKYIKIPDLKVSITRDELILDSAIIKGKKLRALNIQPNNKFSQVMANELVITNHKIDKYDEEFNIIVLEMEANLGNLEDFSLPFVREEGIDWSQIDLPITKIFYYGIVPNNMKKIEFNYFNPSIGEFKKVVVEFDFSKFGEKISTQIEINPNKKSFPYLQTIIISTMILLLLILFIWRKKNIYLIFALITVGILIYSLQKTTITLKGGSKVYLLPTKNSSIFFTIEYFMETEMIKKRNGYYKVLLPDDKIGWIKESDVIKD